MPIYELISGAALAFAALLLIIPGFLTDVFGFLLIIPFTRKLLIKSVSSNFQKRKDTNIVEGTIEEENKEDKENNN